MILDQNRAALVASVICFQKIYGLHGLNHQIIVYSKKEKSDYGKTRGREKSIIARMKICASDLIFPIVAIYVSFTDAVYHLETAVNN